MLCNLATLFLLTGITPLSSIRTVRATGLSRRLESQSTCPNSTTEAGFDWYAVEPSENITWTPCFGQFQCARLSLPLDYSTPDGPKTEIALQMLPATDKANYKGTILFNQGGPGGAGTVWVNASGEYFATIFGPEFDILGFDPRGTGATTPSAQCFNSYSHYMIWNTQGQITDLNETDGSVPFLTSRDKVTGQLCQRELGGNGKEELNGTAAEWGPGRFMDSASVATDMLNIVQRLGQEKLQYAAISYGSALGQYFASMYPDKVGRMYLDGIMLGSVYRSTFWNDLVDAETVISSLYSFCYRAGPSKCPLYESTIDGIRSRVHNIINTVAEAPIAVPFASQGPGLITKSYLSYQIGEAAYTPVTSFPPLADFLVAIESNNQTALSTIVDTSISYQCSCSPPPWLRYNQASYAILCSDGDPVLDTPDQFGAYLNSLTSQSPIFGPIWASNGLQCTQWPIRAKSRYLGPFTGNTSFPILFVSSRYDPVCPLEYAKEAQKLYPGSALLVQNSYGHTALLTPSNCTNQVLRAYFADGTLPGAGMVCEADEVPFISPAVTQIAIRSDSGDFYGRSKLAAAWKRFGKRWV